RPGIVRTVQHARGSGRACRRAAESRRGLPGMNDLRDLYQQIILDHNRNPRNFRELPNATKRVDGYNPLCGDHYTVFVDMDGDVIKDVTFTGNGCAISKSSASVMTTAVKGKRTEEGEKLFDTFHKLVTGEPAGLSEADLGRLAAFSGVS